mgnify:CR=1 FL=1
MVSVMAVWLRRAVQLLLLGVFFVGLITAREIQRGERALRASDEAFHRGDLETSVLHARTGAVAYAPGAPHVDAAYQRLEAIALGTGVLVSRVLDIVENGMNIALLDASAACHMPDVLEMPYRPGVAGAGLPGDKPYTYRLAGTTCLAGDVIGDYSFDQPLRPGDQVVFEDMAHYTMVKNNLFNGVRLPSIALYTETEEMRVLRSFGYDEYRNLLS